MTYYSLTRGPSPLSTSPRSGFPGAFAGHNGRLTAGLVVAIYLACLGAFVTDMVLVSPLAFGVFYAPLVATGIYYDDKRAVWILSAIASAMVILGAFFPSIYPDVTTLLLNRGLSLAAVLATAAFVWHGRRVQDRLAAQTDRAEAAERIKGQVLTNLSQEIRMPLHSMIGVLELIAADGRSEHKAALGMVRTAGRRLATTVDNLVDLTQLEDRTMPAETVDLGMLLHQTTEAMRRDAAIRQIGLSIEIPGTASATVYANAWGLRRILENTIGDAIAYTVPGGTVTARIDARDGWVSAIISDSGTRPPGALQSAAEPDIGRLMPSVMGLALSQRLARAMGANLAFGSGPGNLTTARLSLPARDGATLLNA